MHFVGNFENPEVLAEVFSFIDEYMPNFTRLKNLGTEILRLLFGNSSCSLRQICARQLFMEWVRNEWPCFVKEVSCCNSPSKLPTAICDDNVMLISQHSSYAENSTLISVNVVGESLAGTSQNCNNLATLHTVSEYEENQRCHNSLKRLSVGNSDLDETQDAASDNEWEDSCDEEEQINLLAKVNVDFEAILSYINNLCVQDIEKFLECLHIPKDTTMCFEVELLRFVILCYFGEMLTPSDVDKFRCQYEAVLGSDGEVSEDDSDIEYW